MKHSGCYEGTEKADNRWHPYRKVRLSLIQSEEIFNRNIYVGSCLIVSRELSGWVCWKDQAGSLCVVRRWSLDEQWREWELTLESWAASPAPPGPPPATRPLRVKPRRCGNIWHAAVESVALESPNNSRESLLVNWFRESFKTILQFDPHTQTFLNRLYNTLLYKSLRSVGQFFICIYSARTH